MVFVTSLCSLGASCSILLVCSWGSSQRKPVFAVLFSCHSLSLFTVHALLNKINDDDDDVVGKMRMFISIHILLMVYPLVCISHSLCCVCLFIQLLCGSDCTTFTASFLSVCISKSD